MDNGIRYRPVEIVATYNPPIFYFRPRLRFLGLVSAVRKRPAHQPTRDDLECSCEFDLYLTRSHTCAVDGLDGRSCFLKTVEKGIQCGSNEIIGHVWINSDDDGHH
jgi:hypothetical protein